MGRYKRKVGTRKYSDYKPETLAAALNAIRRKEINVSEAARVYGICRRTLYNKMKKESGNKYGHPTVFSAKEEQSLLMKIFRKSRKILKKRITSSCQR